jgi:hypothetical protein
MQQHTRYFTGTKCDYTNAHAQCHHPSPNATNRTYKNPTLPQSMCGSLSDSGRSTTAHPHATRINILTLSEQTSFSTIHTPRALMKHAKMRVNMEHYANPMVHPITGRTISSYKKLMHDPATAKVWQTAFGKDFGGMAQGCNKTGQKGMNAMFVMAHNEIKHALAAKNFFTYANPVVDYRPQKEDPHRIRITAGGNLIDYDGNASICTVNLNTVKLHWNSVISTENARYMCLDIKKN